MNGWAWFFVLLLLLVLIGAAGWVFFTRRRAERQGLPPPPLSAYNPFTKSYQSAQHYTRQPGVIGWAKSKFQSLKGSGSGAYERPAGADQRRVLDPDGAWDSRVGNEVDLHEPGGYYEEQELGLQPPPSGGPYTSGGYGPPQQQEIPGYGEPERGRRRSRDDAFIGGGQRGLDQRYDEGMARQNPFDDAAERSTVSSKPAELDSFEHSQKDEASGRGGSPAGRRSMFRENV